MDFHARVLSLLLSWVYVTFAMCDDSEDVQIPGPPIIDTHPGDRVVYRRDYISLLCAVKDPSPTIKFRWIKDDQDLILTSTRYRLVGGDLQILHPKRPDDEGKYQCVANNEYGAEISLPTYLRIPYTEPFDLTARLPITVNEGDYFKIRCDPPDHYPPAKYSWHWGESQEKVKPDDRVFISSRTGDLFFRYATLRDSGNYSCVLSDDQQSSSDVGSLTKSPATSVIVQPGNYTSRRPHIRLSPANVHAVEGQTVRIECFDDAIPISKTVWKRRATKEDSVDLPLPGNAVLQSDDHVLVLPDVRRDSAGYYFCEVENPMGRISIFGRLTVDVPAKVTTPGTNIPVRLGRSITLKVTYEGTAPLTVTWYRNANEIVTERKYVILDDALLITDLDFMDRGRYQCVVQNEYGADQASFNLVAVEPTIVKPMKDPQTAMVGENTEVCVRWEASPPFRITWKHKDTIVVQVDENHTVTIINPRMNVTKEGWLAIDDVMTDDEGNYTFTVSNDFGNIQASNHLRVIAPPATISTSHHIPLCVGIFVGLAILVTVGTIAAVLIIRKRRGDRVQSPSRPDAVIVRANEVEAVRVRLYMDDKIECNEDFDTEDTRALTSSP